MQTPVQVFQIAPAGVRALWMIGPALALPLVIVIGVVFFSLTGMRTARFEVSSEGLRLRGDFYGRMIPASDLRGGSARRVPIDAASEFQPVRRTLGAGLPGYRSGWFRLRNGEKALLYVTDPSKAVYVPTRAGYGVMVTPQDPDAFLAAIRSAAPTP